MKMNLNKHHYVIIIKEYHRSKTIDWFEIEKISFKFRSKSKNAISSLQDVNCENQNILSSTNYSLVRALRPYSNDLMGDIEMLINDKMVLSYERIFFFF